MKSSSYQFIYVVIHVVTSSHYICLISASCAMPDPIPNTITTLPNQMLDTGSYLTWECTGGYMMDGLTNTAVWVCLEDGSWLGHTPICNDVECPSPPIAAYSELDPPSPEAPVVNQTISYTCSNSDYTLLGRNFNRCLQDGTWENDPPVCQRTCSTTNVNIERYSNLTCYRRRGSGDWDNSFNRCIDQGEILSTVKDAQTQEFLVGFLRTFSEDNIWIGAIKGRDWKWRKSDKYIERFFWQNPFPESNSGDCIELSYQSGSEKYSWNPRSRQDENALLCQYDQPCQSFGLTQSSMVLEYMSTCFQFLDVSMNCADGARECERSGGFLAEIIDESTNALLVDQALYLRNNNFVAEDTAWWIGGYDDDNNERSWYWSDQTRMIFEAWLTVQPNTAEDDCVEMRDRNQYEWNDRPCYQEKPALCQIGIPACGDPGEPLHGNCLPNDRTTYSVDATLHYTCQEGYTLSGESVLRCMNNGAWNHQRPSCDAVECEGSPPEVALASTMIQGSVYQDIALYTCQDGYIPDNEPISFCQYSGTWSTPNVTCTEIMLRTPITFTTQASPQSTESQTVPTTTSSPTVYSPPISTSAGGFPSSIATVVGSAVGAILVIVIVIALIIIFYKRRSNESASTKSKGKESDSSPQYENPVFDQSQTDAHTYQDLNTITHTYQDCNTDVQSYDDTVDLHTYQEPDQEANYEELNDAKEKNYVNGTMIKQNKVILG